MLAPFVAGLAQVARAQNHEFAFAQGQRGLEQYVVREHEPAAHEIGMVRQRFEDVEKCAEVFDGINIKLMKCGGITPALKMIELGRDKRMKIMAGCMAESSVGISNLCQISPLLDYIDADGAMLMKNDTAKGIRLGQGKIIFNTNNGSGIDKLSM